MKLTAIKTTQPTGMESTALFVRFDNGREAFMPIRNGLSPEDLAYELDRFARYIRKTFCNPTPEVSPLQANYLAAHPDASLPSHEESKPSTPAPQA